MPRLCGVSLRNAQKQRFPLGRKRFSKAMSVHQGSAPGLYSGYVSAMTCSAEQALLQPWHQYFKPSVEGEIGKEKILEQMSAGQLNSSA